MDKGVSHRLHKWEVALGIVLALVLLSGGLSLQSQAALAQDVVRLHVLANSDTEDDQALKLLVRDAVLAQATEVLRGVTTQEQATQTLGNNAQAIEETAQTVVDAQGYDYGVTVSLQFEDFPTKDYEDFSLPAGEYLSLQVIIGEGKGQNWWCVAFPPLCTTATTDIAVTAMAVGLDEGEVALITKQEGYELRFKTMELWGELAQYFE
ncbi:stage II sporulation protein R [Bengtsoniella intestinalis]|uniref:stage II sporulation protein R n=1 Tax=Bengtsoniella intestinalis TaxID=3073143 RepID=UPI00391EE640